MSKLTTWTGYVTASMMVFIAFPEAGAVYQNLELISQWISSPNEARKWIPASPYFILFPAIVAFHWITLWFLLFKLSQPAKKWLLSAQLCLLFIYVATGLYFVPALSTYTGPNAMSYSDEQIRTALTQWQQLDWIRQTIGFIAMWLYVITLWKIISLPHPSKHD